MLGNNLARAIGIATFGAIVAVAPTLPAVTPPAAAADVPTVAIGDGSVHEGDTGRTRTLTFAVSLSAPSATTTTVTYATMDGTTTVGSDYRALSTPTKVLTFKAGQVYKPINVIVLPDTTAEADETLQVMLSGATGGFTIGDPMGTGTIINDDAGSGARLGVGDASVHEGDTKNRPAKFWVTLADPAPTFVTVTAMTMPMSATSGTDYKAKTKLLTFNPGQYKKAFSVVLPPDSTDEPDEQFHVMLQNASGATIVDDMGMGTIVDDDSPSGPTVTTDTFLVGPFNLAAMGQPGDQNQSVAGVPRPAGHIGIKGMRFDLVDGAGTSLGHDEAHLHHIVLLDASRSDSLCPSLPYNRFTGSGMERTPMVLGEDYIYETGAADQWSGTWHVMNRSATARTVYIKYSIDYITDLSATKPVTSYFYDVDGCWGDSEFSVPGGGGPGSVYTKSATYTAPKTGIRVATGGHFHVGGIDISLAQNGSNKCTGTGTYMMMMLMSISACTNPVAVTAGTSITITGRYDNENPTAGQMGIMQSYVWEP